MKVLNYMKHQKYIILLILLFVTMLIIPIITIGFSDNKNETNTDNLIFRVKNETNDEITTLEEKDFICGTVACEMPITFETEALKAQAVAAYTYYKRQQLENKASGLDYDFSCNISSIYKSSDDLKKLWGENYENYHSKLESCVDSVFSEMLTENNRPIIAVFHAISSGMTEASVDIFGGETDYLLPVTSPGDLFAPGYNTVVNISFDDFKNKIYESFPQACLSDNPKNWIGDIDRSMSGSVLSIQIGEQSLTGTQLRNCLSLRSANFDVSNDDSSFTFSVKGYGHGVGMSQYGAQYLALQGSTYDEILHHYYPNTILEKM